MGQFFLFKKDQSGVSEGAWQKTRLFTVFFSDPFSYGQAVTGRVGKWLKVRVPGSVNQDR